MVPLLAYLSKRRLDAGFVIERVPFYIEAVAVQMFLLALATGVGFLAHVELRILQPVDRDGLLLVVAALATAFAAMAVDWFVSDDASKSRLLLIVPRSTRERIIWAAVAASAAIGEEIVYRGVLFGIVLGLVGDAWVAAILCSIVFAAAHTMQGWKNAAIITVFAMGFHWLVMITGALTAGIIIHFIYDVATGWIAGLFRDRQTPMVQDA